MGKRGLGRKGKGGNKDREIIGQHEGRSWQRGKEAPHLACALGPATWGSGPGIRPCLSTSRNEILEGGDSLRLTFFQSLEKLLFSSAIHWIRTNENSIFHTLTISMGN